MNISSVSFSAFIIRCVKKAAKGMQNIKSEMMKFVISFIAVNVNFCWAMGAAILSIQLLVSILVATHSNSESEKVKAKCQLNYE